MNKEEILGLDKKTEQEQIEWLIKRKFLLLTQKYIDFPKPTIGVHESLADCAFRLRDECIQADITAWYLWSGTVTRLLQRREVCTKCKHEHATTNFDWCDNAKPIHWIQSALLAKEAK